MSDEIKMESLISADLTSVEIDSGDSVKWYINRIIMVEKNIYRIKRVIIFQKIPILIP